VLPSGPSPCTWLSHAPSTTPDTTPHQHPADFPFHSTPLPTCLRVPDPRLGSGIVCVRVSPYVPQYPYALRQPFPRPGAHGASQVLRRISSCMPQPEDSGGPPHPRHGRVLRAGFGHVETLAIRNKLISKLYQHFRERDLPYGLQDSLCTLHLLCSPSTSWLRRKCNTRYGWVVSPCPTGTFTRQDAPSLSWRDNV
jgi:hypothetical protein